MSVVDYRDELLDRLQEHSAALDNLDATIALLEKGCEGDIFRRVLEHIRETLRGQRSEMDIILESAVRIEA